MTDINMWQESFKRKLATIARELSEWIGRDVVRAVYLCGSFAANEGTVLLGADKNPAVLSDVDLVVVIDELETATSIYKERRDLSRRCQKRVAEISFIGNIDVGVMTSHDLKNLPPRPGVYEMRNHGDVLYGDDTVLQAIPDYHSSEISGHQGLILVENRIASMLGLLSRTGIENSTEYLKGLYEISRVYTDIAVAAICITGSYISSYRNRINYLKGKHKDVLLDQFISADLLKEIDRWTEFKLEPVIDFQNFRKDQEIKKLAEGASSDILRFWKKGISYLTRGNQNYNHSLSVDELFSIAGRRSFHPDKLRAWKTLLMRKPVIKRPIMAMLLLKNILTIFPLDLIRRHSVKLLEHFLSKGETVPVRKARANYPHSGGSWRRAAASTHAEWYDMVFN